MRLNLIFVARYFSNRMPYYAVARGRKPGIYVTWDECSIQVNKFPGSIYKKFATESEAQCFMKERSSSSMKVNFIEEETVNSMESKCTMSVNQMSSLSPFPKRTLSMTSDNRTSVLHKRRKIISDNIDPESTQCTKQADGMNFITDKDGYVNVFTDGACSSNGCKNARAGIGVWFQDNHPLNISRPVIGRPTNNMAEIQAVTVAAKQAKRAGIKKLRINTDSKFLISCITKWMPKWKKRGWITVNHKPVINKEELLEMEEALKSLAIVWNHINGHIGIHGNEMADKLAREGCLQYKSQNM